MHTGQHLWICFNYLKVFAQELSTFIPKSEVPLNIYKDVKYLNLFPKLRKKNTF